MKIDNIETSKRIEKAFEVLRNNGVKFRDKIELYSFKEGDFLKGRLVGISKISTKNGERVIAQFDVEVGELTNLDGKTENVNGKKVGVFLTSLLQFLIQNDYDNENNKPIPMNRTGHILSIVCLGKEQYVKNKKVLSSYKFNFKDLSE